MSDLVSEYSVIIIIFIDGLVVCCFSFYSSHAYRHPSSISFFPSSLIMFPTYFLPVIIFSQPYDYYCFHRNFPYTYFIFYDHSNQKFYIFQNYEIQLFSLHAWSQCTFVPRAQFLANFDPCISLSQHKLLVKYEVLFKIYPA